MPLRTDTFTLVFSVDLSYLEIFHSKQVRHHKFPTNILVSKCLLTSDLASVFFAKFCSLHYFCPQNIGLPSMESLIVGIKVNFPALQHVQNPTLILNFKIFTAGSSALFAPAITMPSPVLQDLKHPYLPPKVITSYLNGP